MRGEQAAADDEPIREKPAQAHGVLVLRKPCGPTSSACLDIVKKRLGQRKIGHAGTLDPMASGVLPVLLGRATKIASHVMEGEKTYAGELTLGLTTDTWDREGQVLEEKAIGGVTAGDVEREILAWPEMAEQEVPPYSAVKRDGQRLYALARAGKDVPVVIRPVHISRAEIIAIDLPRVRFRVSCSAGAYIRSLAHSLGKRLGVGAILTELVREHCRPFGLDQAWSLEELLEAPEEFASRVTPIAEALQGWEQVVLTPVQEALVRNGAGLPAPLPQDAAGIRAEVGQRRLFIAPDGTPLALTRLDPASASPEGQKDGLPRWAIVRGLW